MKIIKFFNKKNPDTISIIIGLIIFLIMGIVYDNIEIMLIVFLGVLVFGALIGIISALIKLFEK